MFPEGRCDRARSPGKSQSQRLSLASGATKIDARSMKLGHLLGDRDRFEIEQRIGAGGMGQIFRARDRETGEPVAVKIISDVRAHRAARFAREVELLAELTHPGIVRYIAHGDTSDGSRFLVMEWLEGVPGGCPIR